jgi:hypothetical protein
MMLMLGMLLVRGMIMSHKSHHQDVRKRAKKDHAVKQYIVERELKDGYQQDPHHWD